MKKKKAIKRLEKQVKRNRKQICRIMETLDTNTRILEKQAKLATDARTIARANTEVVAEVVRQTDVHTDQIASLKDSVRKLRR